MPVVTHPSGPPRSRLSGLILMSVALGLADSASAAPLVRWPNGAILEPTLPTPGSTWENRNWAFADLRSATMPGVTFRRNGVPELFDLTQARMYNANFAGSTFDGVRFHYAEFQGANLSDVRFLRSHLEYADFTGANIDRARFEAVGFFTSAQFRSTATWADPARRWVGMTFVDPNFSGWDLTGQDLTIATITGDWNLQDADLTGATLPTRFSATIRGAKLVGVDLRDATIDLGGGFSALQGTDFTDAEVAGLTLNIGLFSNNRRLVAPVDLLTGSASYQRGDLRNLGLRNMDLTGWNLAGQDLRGADLYRTNLTGVDFTDADIRDTNRAFSEGFTLGQLQSTSTYRNNQLAGQTFSSMDLAGADFAGLALDGTSFRGSDLTAADFTNATIAGIDLSSASGFTEAQLRSTATYATGNLSGIDFGQDATGWDLAGFDLSSSSFSNAHQARFDRSNLRGATVYSAAGASFNDADLRQARVYDQTDASLVRADLREALLYGVYDNSDFTDARLDGATFYLPDVSEAQLRSTASFKAGAIRHWTGGGYLPTGYTALAGLDLRGAAWNEATMLGVNLRETDLSGSQLGEQWYIDDADARSMNVQNAHFDLPDFDRARMAGADFRGATFSGRSDEVQDLSVADDPEAIIRPDGSVQRWALAAGDELRLWDTRSTDLPTITITESLSLALGAELRFVFEDAAWGSTVGFASGATVDVSGTLALIVAPDADAGVGPGTTFAVFDWSDVTPTGTPEIRVQPGFLWDTTALLTEGTVTLLAAAPLGDFTGDGTVDQADLDRVLNHWGSPITPAAWQNRRGLALGVDQDELDAVLNHWGDRAAPDFRGVAAPEPGVGLVLAGAIALLRRRSVSPCR